MESARSAVKQCEIITTSLRRIPKVWGKHAFKMGYEWLWQNYVSHNISNPRLSLTFMDTNGLGPTGVTTPNTGGITLANIELGYISNYSYNQQSSQSASVDSNQSLYFQDDWRILPDYVESGVRYQGETAHSKFPGAAQQQERQRRGPLLPQIRRRRPDVSSRWLHGWMGAAERLRLETSKRRFQPFVPGLRGDTEPNTVIRGGFRPDDARWNVQVTTQNRN